jgi:hypothetical protein
LPHRANFNSTASANKETCMQPLRGYDSLSLGNLLSGIAPAPLSPPNMPGPWDASDPSAVATPANPVPPGQSGLTRDSWRALKQAMVRLAPYVPPDVLQQHYIRRLAELSNPAPQTVYPVASYDNPLPSGDLLSGTKPAPLSPPNMPTAMDNPFARGAMARFAGPTGQDRQIQPVRADDVPLSTGDLATRITPEPLSGPNMPGVMDDPYVRAAMARLATSPAANGHVQPVRADDAQIALGYLTSGIKPDQLSAPNMPSIIDSVRRQASGNLRSWGNGAAIGGQIGNVIGGILGGLGGAAGGTVVEPGLGTVLGGGVGRAEGAALGSWIGRNVGSAAETAILSMSRPKTGSSGRDYSSWRAGKNRYDDECARQYLEDMERCKAAGIAFGKRGFAVCASSAAQRYSQCLTKGGVKGITTQLLGLESPYD